MKNGAPNKKKRTKNLSQGMLKNTTTIINKVKVIAIKIRKILKYFI
jgi:hypothetical protein